ncbi:hypothetical protein RhiirA4_549565 [Rhizophagus irregularis]|uniref:Uncharacterized protein n=1 Tax=Rhizophagus irregularis TaxID=588596 RepID=A0A2I1HE89_9GLOM|nr:hypothetical protein RhiirA4_549565 [Rhizophagus irregularis]
MGQESNQTNFKEYFGHIFSSHATFYLAKDFNPNFSELTKIKNINNIIPNVGVVTTDKIVEKWPYHNLDDFLDKHKHIKHQKLEGANINLEFFLLIYKIYGLKEE